MSQRTPTDLRNVLATLYPDERSIRRVVDDAGMDSSKMVIDAHAVNSWHSVLSEAEKNHQIEALLKAVETEYGNNLAFRSAYHAYRQATSGSIGNDSAYQERVDHPKMQREPQRQWLPAAIIGLLLIAIITAGWYWGIPGLRNPSIATSTADIITVPDAGRTKVQQAGAPGMAVAAPPPSSNTAIVTQTQISAMLFTSTPEPRTSTPTATLTAMPTPTVTFTPTPQPTATATPVPAPTYPCEAEVVSPGGIWPLFISFRNVPNGVSSISEEFQLGDTIIIQKLSPDERWYKISALSGRVFGWASPEFFNDCTQTSQ